MACERVVIRGNDIDRVRPRFQLSRFCAWRETLLFREFSDTAAVYGFIQIAGCPCGWGLSVTVASGTAVNTVEPDEVPVGATTVTRKGAAGSCQSRS